MAYKDEYEVARLYMKPDFAEQISATFTDPVKVVNHLQPPAARRFGARKIPVGPGSGRCSGCYAPLGGSVPRHWTRSDSSVRVLRSAR
jgi:hypothetical protein